MRAGKLKPSDHVPPHKRSYWRLCRYSLDYFASFVKPSADTEVLLFKKILSREAFSAFADILLILSISCVSHVSFLTSCSAAMYVTGFVSWLLHFIIVQSFDARERPSDGASIVGYLHGDCFVSGWFSTTWLITTGKFNFLVFKISYSSFVYAFRSSKCELLVIISAACSLYQSISCTLRCWYTRVPLQVVRFVRCRLASV